MELEPSELRDPSRLIHEIPDRVRLVEDSAYVALVQHPSTHQRLVEVRQLGLPALLDDGEDISEELREAVEALAPEWRRQAPEHLVMTIIVRPGRCMFGPNELVWSLGWRYANHFAAAYTGDLMLVTEHGWADFMTKDAGHEPKMLPA
jgi:hypothetical protein